MKINKIALIGAIATSLILSACGSRTKPDSGFQSSSVKEHSSIAQVIGTSGGVVKDPDNNLNVNVPAGALSSDTNITATYIESPEIVSNNLSTDFLGAVEFGPDGTTFSKPVQVTINLNKSPKNNSLAVFCYSTQEKVWEYVTDATPSGKKVTFEVTHFSTYQVVDRTKDFLNEYSNIVKHAQANGLSDSEITEAFRDYLVNEKHVMDQYTTYDGYWYEPCGLKISGKYQSNGKSGDPEALSHSEGESNKIGNAYGMSIIDGATSSKQEVKGASSNQEVYDVTVIVEYKIIKPDIELTASKKKLRKGESATINIRCHYTNAQNFYQEYKDLELANYMLTIAKPTNFTTDKSSVLTDSSGRASFVVTAKENDKAETITVNFDVSGNFGTHAEGNITLGSEGYTFNGHIKEEKSFTWSINSPSDISVATTQLGSMHLTVEYDFSGSLIEDDGLFGEMQISNFSASLDSVTCKGLASEEDTVAHYDFDIYKQLNSFDSKDPLLDVSGKVTDNVCSLKVNGRSQTIGTIHGSGRSYTLVISGTDSDDFEQLHTFDITISSGTGITLLDFELEEGTQTNTSATFKDKYEETFIVEGYEGSAISLWGFNMSQETCKTTQTITIE